MKRKSMRLAAAGLVWAAGLLGGVPVGQAAPAATPGDGSPAAHGGHWDVDWDDIRSSVRLTDEQRRALHDTVQKAYEQALKPYAKITPERAAEAARKAEPKGAVKRVKLYAVHGYLVYVVHLAKEKERVLIVVDAGDGRILVHKTAPQPSGDRDD
ncbi:MAG: PepSY domain-containing protein [Alicyclobacillaceae bacterium]|nr:PepSY domain-containing protein [Alicyclobacillaceae bacterium]